MNTDLGKWDPFKFSRKNPNQSATSRFQLLKSVKSASDVHRGANRAR